METVVTGRRWGVTPRESILAECARVGANKVVADCVAILREGEIDETTLVALAGPGAELILGGAAGGPGGYWPRVWAMRGLLHVWDECATDVVIRGSRDESWRVREMSAKVVARHHVEDALDAMIALAKDPVTRVRKAADRATVRVLERES